MMELVDQVTPSSLFVVRVPGLETIGMFTSCSGLELWFDVFEYAEGGNNESVCKLPGALRYPNLVLTSGMTADDALFKWFHATRTSPERKEVILSFQTHKELPVRTYTFVDAFPVHWKGPTSQAGTATIALETLEIAHGGLQGL